MNNETFLRQINHQNKHWWFQARKKIIFEIIKEIELKKNLKILDFGAGSGVNIEMLSTFGKVDVFEKNKIALNFIKKNIKINKAFSKLKMKKNYYDLILLADVIEHIKKTQCSKFINNIKNSIKPRGVLIIGCPSQSSQKYASKYSKKLHVNCFDKDRLQNYLNNFFKNVFTFGMNDEVLHTGYDKMCHYVFAICVK